MRWCDIKIISSLRMIPACRYVLSLSYGLRSPSSFILQPLFCPPNVVLPTITVSKLKRLILFLISALSQGKITFEVPTPISVPDCMHLQCVVIYIRLYKVDEIYTGNISRKSPLYMHGCSSRIDFYLILNWLITVSLN